VVQTDFTRVYGQANPDIQFEYASQTQDDGTYTATGGFFLNGAGAYGLPTVALDTRRNMVEQQLVNPRYRCRSQLWRIRLSDLPPRDRALVGAEPSGLVQRGGRTQTFLLSEQRPSSPRTPARYTVMSYFGGYQPGVGWQNDGNESAWLYSSTPMLYDRPFAAQAIYGADYNTPQHRYGLWIQLHGRQGSLRLRAERPADLHDLGTAAASTRSIRPASPPSSAST